MCSKVEIRTRCVVDRCTISIWHRLQDRCVVCRHTRLFLTQHIHTYLRICGNITTGESCYIEVNKNYEKNTKYTSAICHPVCIYTGKISDRWHALSVAIQSMKQVIYLLYNAGELYVQLLTVTWKNYISFFFVWI